MLKEGSAPRADTAEEWLREARADHRHRGEDGSLLTELLLGNGYEVVGLARPSAPR